MVVHGSLDSLAAVNEGRVFSQKLREVSKNPVVYTELDGAEHAWEVVHSLRTEHTIDGVHRFLEWARAGNVPNPICARESSTENNKQAVKAAVIEEVETA